MISFEDDELIRRSHELRKFCRTTVSDRTMFKQSMSEVGLEINKMQTAIHTLEHRMQRLKDILSMYESLSSPIQAMPPEILSLIFSFACEKNELERSRLPPTVVISMVCGRWRDVVNTSPRLWSSFYIDFTEWIGHFQVLDTLTRMFIERSRSAQLHLGLMFPEDDLGNESPSVGAIPIINLLVAHCARWRTLDLWLTSPFLPIEPLRPIRGCLPVLTRLHLGEIYSDIPNSPWGLDPLDLFDTCPSLRYVQINPTVIGPDVLRIPWHQIETLQVAHCYAVLGFPLLMYCQNARNIELMNIGGVDEEEDDKGYTGPAIVQPWVTSTTIHASFQDEVDDFFRYTTLPKLSSLTITSLDEEADEDERNEQDEEWIAWGDRTDIQGFLNRSSCVITSLSLIQLPIIDVQILNLLQMIPSLESLTIDELPKKAKNRIVTKALLDGLAESTTKSIPTLSLPRLTRIKMVVHSTGLDTQALMRLLTARWTPNIVDPKESEVACLRSVEIVVRTRLKGDKAQNLLDCLRCFKDAGMKLYVTYV